MNIHRFSTKRRRYESKESGRFFRSRAAAVSSPSFARVNFAEAIQMTTAVARYGAGADEIAAYWEFNQLAISINFLLQPNDGENQMDLAQKINQ